MKIACLQFAPQVGDLDNNLNRADAVLNKADPFELDNLDLLVLPELAFTGYNFSSLREISPFLEPSGSGISSLWARTTALRHNCFVSVGYPEKVDLSKNSTSRTEYYNSAILVNGDGETVANYRKAFLYPTDELWAQEGKKGFYQGEIPELGNTVMGICMDLNPYKFESPWNAFEFGFHILKAKANLVIVSMAWMTREDTRLFTRMPQEPDLESLTYWIQRLEPLIRVEKSEEVIVVFCNRCGNEGETVYCGTSAVLGVKEGEILVYGLLGRGDKELLVVDTELPPFAKLVQKLELQGASSPRSVGSGSSRKSDTVKSVPESKEDIAATPTGLGIRQKSNAIVEVPEEVELARPQDRSPEPNKSPIADSSRPKVPKLETGPEAIKPKGFFSPDTPSALTPQTTPTRKRSSSAPSSPQDKSPSRRKAKPSPKIQIPYTPSLDEISSAIGESPSSSNCSVAGSMPSPDILTPSYPSPVPHHLRPVLSSLNTVQPPYQHQATPYPGDEEEYHMEHECGGSPTTPFFDLGETPMTPACAARLPFARSRAGRTPIEGRQSPFSQWPQFPGSSNYTSRPSFKPMASQLAISAMTSHLRSNSEPSEGKPSRPNHAERVDGLVAETSSKTTPQPTYQSRADLPRLSTTPVPAVQVTAAPTRSARTSPTSQTSRSVGAMERRVPPTPPESPDGNSSGNQSEPSVSSREELTPRPSPTHTEPCISEPLYPTIVDPIYRPQSSLPIDKAQPARVRFPDQLPSKSKGIIPIIASPSVLDFNSRRISTSISEPGTKPRKSRGRRSQSQQPTEDRSQPEGRRSRSLVGAHTSRHRERRERTPLRNTSALQVPMQV